MTLKNVFYAEKTHTVNKLKDYIRAELLKVNNNFIKKDLKIV